MQNLVHFISSTFKFIFPFHVHLLCECKLLKFEFWNSVALCLFLYLGISLWLFSDTNLKPWSTYEYTLSVTNKAGTQSTDYRPIKTAQSTPAGLAPPTVIIGEGQLYVITMEWSAPTHPNGVIVKYSLQRSTGGGQPVEIFRGESWHLHRERDCVGADVLTWWWVSWKWLIE